VDVTVHHILDVACFRIRAVVFDHRVWVEHIGTDLASPADFLLFATDFKQFFFLFLDFQLIEFRFQKFHRLIAVFDLGTFGLAGNDRIRRQVRDPDGRVRRIDVLSAGSTRAVRVDFQVFRTDIQLNFVIELLHDLTRYKRGMASAGRIERRNPDKTVYAFFRYKLAVCIVYLDAKRDRLDPLLFTGQVIDRLHLEAAHLAPTGIHAEQHRGPVLGFRAARGRVQLEDGIV